LNVTDEGGQMDVAARKFAYLSRTWLVLTPSFHIKAKGSSCADWKLYVNMIEPTTKTYCMRCCVSRKSYHIPVFVLTLTPFMIT
jgi:hypothetical protein